MATAIVTGGSKGIGAAVVAALGERGWKVAVLDIAAGAPYRCDVADQDSVAAAVGAVEADLGPIALLVNNAGVSSVVRSEHLSEQAWRRTLDVIATGTFLCSREVGLRMLAAAGGSIVNIASINATAAWPGRLAYSAAKAAVKMMTEVLAVEWAGRGVRVNTVSPGVTLTDHVKDLIAAGKVTERDYLERTPAGRMARPEEVAAAVVYLASPEAEFVTGANLVIDGGWTANGF